MNLIFKYDPKIEENLLLNTKLFDDETKDLFSKRLKREQLDKGKLKDIAEVSERLWKEHQSSYYLAIAEFFEIKEKDIPDLGEITVYLSRLPRHPYNFKRGNFWFSAPLDAEPYQRLRVIVHELTHFYFFALGWKNCMEKNGFNLQIIDDAKETISTILVNTSFKNFLNGAGEAGHERNKAFRIFVAKNAKNPNRITISEILSLAKKYQNNSDNRAY